jgi:hypothetical protein
MTNYLISLLFILSQYYGLELSERVQSNRQNDDRLCGIFGKGVRITTDMFIDRS